MARARQDGAKEARPEGGSIQLLSDQPPTKPLTLIDKAKGSQLMSTLSGYEIYFFPLELHSNLDYFLGYYIFRLN